MKNKEQECIFCHRKDKPISCDSQVIFKGEHSFIMLNLYPYNNGHLMIAPYRHIGTISQLNEEERKEMFQLLALCEAVLTEASNPQGFNIGINIGKAAGAGFAEHIHIHIVPRWIGDTNFMSVVEDVRVLPESVEETYKRLEKYFQKLKSR